MNEKTEDKEEKGRVHEHPHRHSHGPPKPKEVLDKLVPEETRKHLTNARKEWLLAVRSLIDERIDQLEEKEQASKESRQIEIE